MRILFSLIAVAALIAAGWGLAQVAALHFVLGVVLPYAAIVVFILGIVYRVLRWAASPVPFKIPTTSGQQKSLPWIRNSYWDNPHSKIGVIGRMLLEVLFFRSLFRNTKTEIKEGPRVVYGSNKYLWAAALAFHYTFLIILLRHFRFFFEPVPGAFLMLQDIDGFLQVGVPVIFATDLLIVAAASWLFLRRIWSPQLRYISQAADYFPLLLILAVALSGIWMRFFDKVNLVAVKELSRGLVTLNPAIPEGIGASFYVHLFLICALFFYFPFSKLAHMAGVFLSPTRNLSNNNRRKRHINPWNPDVEIHTYEQWEEEYKDKIKMVGLPLDKE